MAKLLCDAGTLSVGGSVVAELRNVSLSGAAGTTNGQAIVDTYPEEFVTSKVYNFDGEAYATEADDTILGTTLGATVTVVLTSQKGTPTTLFNGACIVVSVGDTQAQGGLEMQRIGLRSTGAPSAVAI
jgi:hypothetical protein